MNKKIFSALTVAAIALFSACTNAIDDLTPPGSEENKGNVHVMMRSIPSNADERAIMESKITQIEIYVFNRDGSRDEETPYFTYGSIANEAGISANEFSFSVESGVGKTIMAIANVGAGALSNPGNGYKTLDEVKKELLGIDLTHPLTIPGSGIPMSREAGNVTVNSGEIKSVTIELERFYSRFETPTAKETEVKITNAEELKELAALLGKEEIKGDIGFDLNAHIVVNGISDSYLFPCSATGTDGRWNPEVWQLGNNTSNYHASIYGNQGTSISYAYSGTAFLTNDEKVYLYENAPLRIFRDDVWGYDPATVYALIIRGELWDTQDPSTKVTRYWRINVNRTKQTDTNYIIERNSIYNVDIVAVNTIGHGTPEEAEEEKPIIPDVDDASVDVNIQVVGWDKVNTSTDM